MHLARVPEHHYSLLGSVGQRQAPLPLLQYLNEWIKARYFIVSWIKTRIEHAATRDGKGLSVSVKPFIPKEEISYMKTEKCSNAVHVQETVFSFEIFTLRVSTKSSIHTLLETWQLQFQPQFILPVKVCIPIPGCLYSQACCSVSSTSDYLVNAINQNPIAENACISPTHLLPWQQFRLLFICQATSVEINSIVFTLTVLSVLDLIHGKI